MFSYSLVSIFEGLIPLAFLLLLLPSLFGASSNLTTLSRCLRTTGDLSRRVRVASLLGSGLIIGLVLAKVDARYANGVFSRVVAANTVVITGGLSPVASKKLKSSCDGCWILKSWITCVYTNGNTTLSEAQGVPLRITSGVREEDPIRARRADLRARERGTSSSDIKMGLDVADTLCFQLGRVMKRMTWRQFILALGLHYEEEMAEAGFGAYWYGSERVIPDKGDLRDYWMKILSDKDFLGPDHFYVYIRDHVRRLCHRMIAYSIFGRGQGRRR
ncbi:hypothetical protein Tco_0904238 [Tanacetum coccineum]